MIERLEREQLVKLRSSYQGVCGGCGHDWGATIQPLIDDILALRVRNAELEAALKALKRGGG
jgi:hypothetical protein